MDEILNQVRSMEGALHFVEHHQRQVTTTRQSGYTQPSSSSSPKGYGSSKKRNDASHKGHQRFKIVRHGDQGEHPHNKGHSTNNRSGPAGPPRGSNQQRPYDEVVKDNSGQESQLDTDLEAHEVLELPQSEAGEEPQNKASVEQPLKGPQYETNEELTVKAANNYDNDNDEDVVYIWSMHDQFLEVDPMHQRNSEDMTVIYIHLFLQPLQDT
ncbi:hypothetical protein BV22DRAFT_1134511 [Leucogyrophana mollusca]|uniref:Uncharacterized protein n=1 Tax=Leucogyrophana mollusca TaxID=85980 RepID=A0ACB8B1G4_9AGAM|nr:hypothetical protein BV22DRAFT_1134511 [Leucogyrophana mollusca]